MHIHPFFATIYCLVVTFGLRPHFAKDYSTTTSESVEVVSEKTSHLCSALFSR